jgi:Arc/MetJ-type ribon-helix-helix transcriptional regulator
MTITLPTEQDRFLSRLVASGRFASPQEAVTEAVRRLETEEALGYLNPKPLTAEEAAEVYAADVEWEKVERAVSGRARPEMRTSGKSGPMLFPARANIRR